ncbi:sugar phosphate isomerase/epimerase family protein [Nisaea sediminum]|uniref:sugar phosphate isomerase/epimerase family protein n=1 Tax=Nisaea sediminum TaxID=2775867 RepID=UPI0018693C69|nr:sugar phosphate isomerase/epimerase [Nisaea sediminum]
MRVSISNIAWNREEFDRMLDVVSEAGGDAIELAPNSIWQEPIKSSPKERKEFMNRVSRAGLDVSGFHALLFTRPDLALFRDKASSREYADYLIALGNLAVDLEAGAMVLGSPRNRARGSLGLDEAWSWAVESFRYVAEELEKAGEVDLCIEPLAPSETDFISSVAEGWDLAAAVDHKRFGLLIDTKAVFESEADPLGTISGFGARARHFHISNPGLGPVYNGEIDHAAVGKALRGAGYKRYVTIEMRRLEAPNEAHVRKALQYAKSSYLS